MITRAKKASQSVGDPGGSEEDIQSLRRSGNVSFDRDETFADSEDEFFEQRDQIMLDGSTWGKASRKVAMDYMSASDEEILPLEGVSEGSEDEDDDDEEVSDGRDDDRSILDEEEGADENDVDKEAWGNSRKAYYGADDLSDEEDVAAEEQEAERLQKKHLAKLRPEDFLDTWADVPADDGVRVGGKVVSEELPRTDLSKLSKPELLKILKNRHPDVLRLANLYTQLQPCLSSLNALLKRTEHPQYSTIQLKCAILSCLLSSIAVYFALRADAKERGSSQKKIVAKINETETLWNQISAIPIDENILGETPVPHIEHIIENPIPGRAKPKQEKRKELSRKRKRYLLNLAEESDGPDDDLATAVAILKKYRSKSKENQELDDDLSDFADPRTLHPIDAQEKARNKKTLRFYAAQIETKAAKRREKYSGDTEVFKERRIDKEKRQLEEAKKRGHQHSVEDTTALDDGDPPTPPASDDEENDYYDLLATKKAHKKAHAKEEYEASKAAARAYLLGELEEPVDESGKRLITRQIEKNKGLMPHRSKDVRNPRVKKRKKYEKKKKDLKGRRAAYQVGDRRRAAYGGEETGISKNIVKAIKLS